MSGAGATQRIDKWLWFTRFLKTRSLAARLCSAGAVTVEGRTVLKPNHPLKVGDEVTIIQGRYLRRVVVLGLGERRGPAPEARLLYSEPHPPASIAQDDWQPLLRDEPAG